MSARIADSAAPANAIKIWCDPTRIYAELPSLGPVCVMAFPRTGEGLSKVLNLIYGSGEASGSPQTIPRRKPVGSVSQHSLAESILRRHRVIR